MTELQAYPSAPDPKLIKEGEVRSDENLEDSDLKQYEQEEHIGFIRKVLGIVTIQMGVTFLFCVISSLNDKAGAFFKHPLTLILSFILLIFCVCAIAASKKNRRTVPLNYFLLAGATVGETCFLAATAADLKIFSVFAAIAATCLAVAALFVAALYSASSMDRETLLRNMVKAMIVTLILHLIMIVFIVFSFAVKDKALVIGISCGMLVISGAYVMFALLFIIIPGITDKDDYILGALRLYLEIARLFYWILKLLGKKKN